MQCARTRHCGYTHQSTCIIIIFISLTDTQLTLDGNAMIAFTGLFIVLNLLFVIVILAFMFGSMWRTANNRSNMSISKRNSWKSDSTNNNQRKMISKHHPTAGGNKVSKIVTRKKNRGTQDTENEVCTHCTCYDDILMPDCSLDWYCDTVIWFPKDKLYNHLNLKIVDVHLQTILFVELVHCNTKHVAIKL